MNKKLAVLSIILAVAVGFGSGFLCARSAKQKAEPEKTVETVSLPAEEPETAKEAPAEAVEEAKEAPAAPVVDYRGIVSAFDFGDEPVYAIGHKSPDADTVCSAIAYANLKRALGLNCEPRVSGKINNQTKYILEYFGVEVPEILDNAAGKQIILIDHNASLQAVDGMADARIVEMLEHHNIADLQTSEPIYVKAMPIGATATIVYTSYIECGVPVDKQTAGILLGAILSDTGYFKGATCTEYDKTAAAELAAIAGVDDLDTFWAALREADLSFDGMTEEEILMSDFKQYNMGMSKVGIGCFTVLKAEEIDPLLARLAEVTMAKRTELGLDLLYLCANTADYRVGK